MAFILPYSSRRKTMTKKLRDSKIAEELIKRGFNKIAQAVTLAIREDNAKVLGLSRNQRRILAAKPFERHFSVCPETGVVCATDDTGQSWHGTSVQDLKEIGFTDRTGDLIIRQRDFSGDVIH